MANTQTSNQALTADSITDQQIHELRLAVRAERAALDIKTTSYGRFVELDHAEHQCRVALGEKRASRGFSRAKARARCAEILNARSECPHYGEFGHVHGGPSYDRQPCPCGKAFRAEGK